MTINGSIWGSGVTLTSLDAATPAYARGGPIGATCGRMAAIAANSECSALGRSSRGRRAVSLGACTPRGLPSLPGLRPGDAAGPGCGYHRADDRRNIEITDPASVRKLVLDGCPKYRSLLSEAGLPASVGAGAADRGFPRGDRRSERGASDHTPRPAGVAREGQNLALVAGSGRHGISLHSRPVREFAGDGSCSMPPCSDSIGGSV